MTTEEKDDLLKLADEIIEDFMHRWRDDSLSGGTYYNSVTVRVQEYHEMKERIRLFSKE